MWVVKISPSSKEKDEQFEPFKAKYEKMSEAKKAAKALIKKEMESAFPTNVPLLVEVGVGDNWLEAH